MSIKKLSPVYMNKYDFVKRQIKNLPKKTKILDVGCGYGEYLKLYKKKGFVVKGIDVDKEAIKENKEAILSYAEKLPFKNNSFDTVSCIDVLEHVNDPKKAMSEISRVLKKNGKLILSVPNFNFPFTYDPINYILKFFGTHLPIGLWHWGHRRLFKKDEILSLIKKNKISIEHVEQRSHFLIALFVNYIPYIMDIIKSKKSKRKEKQGIILRTVSYIYGIINKIDSVLFKNLKGINICVIGRKK